MSNLEDFYTREAANSGIEVPLYLPDGEKSEHSLTIRGVDSDAFRAAKVEVERRALRLAGEGKEPDPDQDRLDLLVTLVAGWTFDKECTPENVREFLINAPRQADAIDRIAARQSLFFARKPTNSKPTRKSNSGSRKSRKARK